MTFFQYDDENEDILTLYLERRYIPSGDVIQ
jgi:hypothetical protein